VSPKGANEHCDPKSPMSAADPKRTSVAQSRFTHGSFKRIRPYNIRTLWNGASFETLKFPSFPESNFKIAGLYARCCSTECCGVLALDLVTATALAARPLLSAACCRLRDHATSRS
jgi:hypothetical protein